MAYTLPNYMLPRTYAGPYSLSGETLKNWYGTTSPWMRNIEMQRYGVTPYAIHQATGLAPRDIQNNATLGYYAPPTNTTEGLKEPYYGTFKNFSAKDLQNAVTGMRSVNETATKAKQQAADDALNPPPQTFTAPTTIRGNSGDPLWDKIVDDFNVSHRAGFGIDMNRAWDADSDAQAAYSVLQQKYNAQKQASLPPVERKAASPVEPVYNQLDAQKLAAAMKQTGVSAYDLATSGALTPQQYTETFRPTYAASQLQNQSQYYQPIYQTQYQNYASPAFSALGNASGMGRYNERANQQYVSPMSLLSGGGFNPYAYRGGATQAMPTQAMPMQAMPTQAMPMQAMQAPSTAGSPARRKAGGLLSLLEK